MMDTIAGKQPDLRGARFIAVMGMTGTGKSTFVSHLTKDYVPVGDSLVTAAVACYRCDAFPTANIFLIDTPGYDDTYRSQGDLLKELSSYMVLSLSTTQLHGLIYMHPVQYSRGISPSLSPRWNLPLLRKLLGAELFSKVVLTTTGWDRRGLNIAAAEEVESALSRDPAGWGFMAQNGSRQYRLFNTDSSARQLIEMFLPTEVTSASQYYLRPVGDSPQTGASSPLAEAHATVVDLCTYCSKVPLNATKLRFSDKSSLEFSLGYVSRIFRSSPRCSLCKLVSSCIREVGKSNSDRQLRADAELSISWINSFGPEKGSFCLSTWTDINICFVEPPLKSAITKNTFCLRPNVDGQLNYLRVCGWLGTCQNEHGQSCWPKHVVGSDVGVEFPGLKVLRFVDVTRRCIVELTSVPEYVALSYVWGVATSLRLTSLNETELGVSNSLSQYWKEVPRTIRDAITLAEKIKCKYLWVDSLCLLQNDSEDLELGIKVMDLLYEKATMTIVAASGHDANYGLPGVQLGSRTINSSAVTFAPGISLDVHVGVDRLLRSSIYSTRAWTFQEESLSPRILYFVDDKVFFRCRSTTFAESWSTSLDGEGCVAQSLSSPLSVALQMLEPARDFDTVVSYYSCRALSNQQDALLAMAGLIRRFSSRMKCQFLEGLPTAMFDHFLLFRSDKYLLSRRRGFPSYSWAGWRGSLHFGMRSIAINPWLNERTWIIWHKISTGTGITPVWDASRNKDFPWNDSSYPAYRTRKPFEPPGSLGIVSYSTVPSKDFGSTTATSPKYHLLQFWTIVVSFKISCYDTVYGLGLVLGERGERCGAVYLDDFEQRTPIDPSVPCTLIVLSKASHLDWQNDRIHTHSDGLGSLYNVMVLDTQDGVAERRGLGFIAQDALDKGWGNGATWNEIILG